MAEIHIAYEIERRDYAEANAAIQRASRRSYIDVCVILGAALLLLFLPFAYREPGTAWTYPYLVVPFGAYLLYWATLVLSPFLAGVVSYKRSSVRGKKYTGHFSAAEVRVSGEDRCWINQWRSFKLMSESKTLFLLYDGNTMFIFAKRYFTAAQVEDLRQLLKEAQAGK